MEDWDKDVTEGEPNWEKVLYSLYRNQEKWSYFGEGREPSYQDHPILGNIDISSTELQAAIEFLKDQELIEETDGDTPVWKLTKRGFDKIQDRESMKNQHQLNATVAWLTAGLLAINAIAQFSTWESYKGVSQALPIISSLLVIVILLNLPGLGNFLYRSGDARTGKDWLKERYIG